MKNLVNKMIFAGVAGTFSYLPLTAQAQEETSKVRSVEEIKTELLEKYVELTEIYMRDSAKSYLKIPGPTEGNLYVLKGKSEDNEEVEFYSFYSDIGNFQLIDFGSRPGKGGLGSSKISEDNGKYRLFSYRDMFITSDEEVIFLNDSDEHKELYFNLWGIASSYVSEKMDDN